MLNLVNNAREAIQGPGEIVITTRPDPARAEWVRLEVRDTGCGIPEEHRVKVFDPFFTTKAGGTGLGLPVSYGIVRDHGDILEVESRVGTGSTAPSPSRPPTAKP